MNSHAFSWLKKILLVFILPCILLASTYVYATVPVYVFNIVPKAGTTLPTTVFPNSTATAFYTVTNNTLEQRNSNYVKYLPPNVEQVTSGGVYPNTCGTTFNLSPLGTAGDSCTLQLTVFGPVNGADPNPHDHLFVCFPGGITCAGTNYGLNVNVISLVSVTVVPALANINASQTIQYTATANFSNGSSQIVTTSSTWASSNPSVATINTVTGQATGVSTGTTSITATYQGLVSNSATLTVNNPIAFIVVTPASATINVGSTKQFTATAHFFNGTTADISTTATWTSTNPTVATIDSTGLATGVSPGTTSITASAQGITSPASTLTVNNLLLSIAITPLTSNISTGGTQQYTAIGTFASGPPQDITATVTWNSSSTSVATITSGVGGGLATGISVGTSNITATLGLVTSNTAVQTVHSFIYIVNNGLNVLICNINSSGGINSGDCLTSTLVANPQQIALNPAQTLAYVTSPTNHAVSVCTINSGTGEFTGCIDSGFVFSAPAAITINPANTFAYVGDGNTLLRCVINGSNGTLSLCSPTASGFTTPGGIVITPASTFAYITDKIPSPAHIVGCVVDNLLGTLNSCVANPLFANNPTGVAITPSASFVYTADDGSAEVTTNVFSGTTLTTSIDNTVANNNPVGVAVNRAGTLVYFTDRVANTLEYCTMNGNGTLNVCNTITSLMIPLNIPFGIAIQR